MASQLQYYCFFLVDAGVSVAFVLCVWQVICFQQVTFDSGTVCQEIDAALHTVSMQHLHLSH